MFKGFLSEGGIRAPLIVAGKGVTGSGRISDAVAHIMDIPATILDVAGVRHPDLYQGKPVAPLQGLSLAPVLNTSRDAIRGPADWTGWELFGNRAIRMGNWKLLWMCKPHGSGAWQLYDLQADPAETNDLAAAQPEILGQMIGHWDDYASKNNVVLPDRSPVCAMVD
jgi:arylsulfatase